jgi:hypothetical protein
MHPHSEPLRPLPLYRSAIDGRTEMTACPDSLDQIDTLKFARRKESWVASSSAHFYKAIRKSNDPLRDLDDPACIDIAMREYTDVCFLHGLDDGVCCPERIDRACIVYPFLSGPDMRTLLISHASHEQREACLLCAMRLLARLHRGDAAGYPVKDYRRDSFLAPSPAVLDWMEGRRQTLVVAGFEARNFRFDQNSNAWFFFDPHYIWLGFPEEDFARFLVSLLMIRGRRSGPRPWTGFDRFRLLADYETLAPAKLDRALLNYFLHEELAMRRFHAVKLARRMPPAVRPFVMTYTRFYYHQLRRALAFQLF